MSCVTLSSLITLSISFNTWKLGMMVELTFPRWVRESPDSACCCPCQDAWHTSMVASVTVLMMEHVVVMMGHVVVMMEHMVVMMEHVVVMIEHVVVVIKRGVDGAYPQVFSSLCLEHSSLVSTGCSVK